MCGRYTIQDAIEFLEKVFQIFDVSSLNPRYNIAPTQEVPVIRFSGEKNDLSMLKWGLIPSWAKDKSMAARMINARSETLLEKPSFKSAFKSRRCLLVADGFYEWHKTNGSKQPYYIKLQTSEPFVFAGLWDRWTGKDEVIESCTIITTTANDLLSSIHHRMPVILPASHYELWLDARNDDVNALNEVLNPYPSKEMIMYPVASKVNNARYDQKDCIVPVET